MPRTCVIRGCNSNRFAGSEYTPTFTFPTQAARYKQWFHLINPNQDPNMFIGVYDTVCITHFEEKYICRTTVAFDSNLVRHTVPRNKLCLTKDAVPTINLDLHKQIQTISDDSNDDEGEKKPIKMRIKKPLTASLVSSKSRIRKNKRRERVKKLIKGRVTVPIEKPDTVTPLAQEIRNARKQIFVKADPVEVMELEDSSTFADTDGIPKYNVKDDYLLGSKTESTDEMLIINLRLPTLIKPLRDGLQLCKNPSKFETNNVYPTLNLVHQIDGFENAAMNPVFWSTDQVFSFIKHISTTITVAKKFRAEDIDGAALMNLSKSDLIKYMQLSPPIAGLLSETIKKLRNETIHKFLNVKATVSAK